MCVKARVRGLFVDCSPSEGASKDTLVVDLAANAKRGAASGAAWGHGCRFTGGAVRMEVTEPL